MEMQWEYHFLDYSGGNRDDRWADVQKLGKEGWELVAVVTSGGGDYADGHELIFKRPLNK